MQIIYYKAIISLLPALIIGIEIAKTKTSFLKIWYNYLNNRFFYWNYSTKFVFNHFDWP